jgi:hypothetical protein
MFCSTPADDAASCAQGFDIPADTTALCERVMLATPGDMIVYHLGLLARDRDRNASELPDVQRLELDAVADYAWRLADAGWCHLLQRRVALECFAYLVVICPRPRQQRTTMPQPSTRAHRVHRPAPSLVLAEAA